MSSEFDILAAEFADGEVQQHFGGQDQIQLIADPRNPRPESVPATLYPTKQFEEQIEPFGGTPIGPERIEFNREVILFIPNGHVTTKSHLVIGNETWWVKTILQEEVSSVRVMAATEKETRGPHASVVGAE